MERTNSRPSDRPTIFVATLLHSEGPTGVQTHIQGFARVARAAGLEVDIVTSFSLSRLIVYPVFAVRKLIDLVSGSLSVWWYRKWHEFFLFLALRSKVSGAGKAVIYAQCPLSARAALAARAGMKNKRVVLVVHFNKSQALEWAEKGMISKDGWMARSINQSERNVLPAVDGLVYVSKFMRDYIQSQIGAVRSVPAVVVPNFCDSVTPEPRSAPPTYDLINVGTLEPRKNQQLLLRALRRVRDRGYSLSLALVGDGPSRSELERLTVELGLENQVVMLGYQPRAATLMGQARIYVHSAKMETFAIVLIEAMASGLPIVALKAGGIPEVVADGVHGFVLEEEDPETFATAILALVKDPKFLKSAGDAARRHFEVHFCTTAIGPRLLEFVLNEYHSPRQSPLDTTEPAAGRVADPAVSRPKTPG